MLAVLAPNGGEQLRLGAGAALVGGEHQQQVEFQPCQGQPSAAAQNLPGLPVDDQSGKGQPVPGADGDLSGVDMFLF